MGMGFPAERTQKCQAPIKSAQPFPGPRTTGGNFMDIKLFLILRRLLRRLLETAFEKVLRGVLRRCLAAGFRVLRRVLRRDSKKGLSRRHLESFLEYLDGRNRAIQIENR